MPHQFLQRNAANICLLIVCKKTLKDTIWDIKIQNTPQALLVISNNSRCSGKKKVNLIFFGCHIQFKHWQEVTLILKGENQDSIVFSKWRSLYFLTKCYFSATQLLSENVTAMASQMIVLKRMILIFFW